MHIHVTLVIALCFRLFSFALTPISCSLVPPKLGQVCFRPEPQTDTGNHLHSRFRDELVANPAVQCATVYP
jgi:hypothetical protein